MKAHDRTWVSIGRIPAMVLATLLCLGTARARAEETVMDAARLAHAMDRLANTGRVLYVAAHPDDENTRLLGYLANARHVTVAYLSLTRGEGGQNLIGAEKGPLLGLIRTQELLAARRLDGAQQRFSRLRDFGYSKSAEETFAKWGHEAALADVVWTLRTFQPDVVITRFNEQPPNHGHHTASAILAREAVAAAADATRFPEQLEQGVTTWKVDRLLHNFPTWRDKPPADALAMDVGAYDARLGLSYGELAALSRSEHKSQGFGSAGERGELLEHFVHLEGTRPGKDLLEGLELGWARLGPQAERLTRALTEAQAALSRDAPEQALPALLRADAELERLPSTPRTRDARRAIPELVAGMAGLFVRATAPVAAVSPGQRLPVRVEVVMRRPAGLTLRKVRFPGMSPEAVNAPLGTNEKRELSAQVEVPAASAVSVPYWLPATEDGARDAVTERSLVGLPEGPPPLAVELEFEVEKRPIRLRVPVQHVWTDRVHGERERLVLVSPPVTVTPEREAVMVSRGAAASVSLLVRAARDGVDAEVRIPVPAGWKVQPASRKVSLKKAGEETRVAFDVRAPPGAGSIQVSPEALVDGKAWSYRADTIDYPHIPVMGVLQAAKLRLSPLAVRLPKGTVGYVEGSGDTVASDLAHIGMRVERLDDATLRTGDLKRFSAIVLGVRALNTRDVLRGSAFGRLMDFVQAGGTLVVQYNTQSRWSPLEAAVGPFPLTLGSSRITDETARVQPLRPEHAVLARPNRIGPPDFEGWVQERGLYFAERWDERYQPLLEMADPGEEPLRGGLLVADHGKGRFVYTGLSFFRQLPAGVPGAYRLMVNLVSGRGAR